MKIINKNKLYVQKSDVEVALKDKKRMPGDISAKLEKRLTEEKEESEKSFLLFDDESIANYFKGLDYILDYNVLQLSWTEAVKLCESAIIELNKASEDSRKGLDEEDSNIKIALLKYKLETIKEVVKTKKGNMVVGTVEKTNTKKKLFNIGKRRK